MKLYKMSNAVTLILLNLLNHIQDHLQCLLMATHTTAPSHLGTQFPLELRSF